MSEFVYKETEGYEHSHYEYQWYESQDGKSTVFPNEGGWSPAVGTVVPLEKVVTPKMADLYERVLRIGFFVSRPVYKRKKTSKSHMARG